MQCSIRRDSGVAAAGKPGRIRWENQSLDVAETGAARVGERVAWLIPTDYVVLGDGAGAGEANVVTGTLSAITRLGERCMLVVQLGAAEQLRFSMTSRELGGCGLEIGSALSLRLLPEGIHLMPPAQQLRRG